ncbi:MAG: 1-deoxy-D-xylulose-5-phosphate reductoisomerase, partial [Clostridia bacterium]|nr:1-deoxy-D-xylulose-5-phosphate reductoisomerase [Clostridia bacterium]
ESIIHSAVEYIDNSVIAQMSSPDMRLCIQYALSEPARLDAASAELDLIKIGNLSFAEPDTDTFSLLSCAVNCMKKGGALPAVLNAANEVAVEEFLLGRLSFLGITDVVEETVLRLGNAVNAVSLDDILAFDENARSVARQIIASR